MRANAAAWLIAAAAVVGAWFYGNTRAEDARREATDEAQRRIHELEVALSGANDVVNDEVSKTAARYLVLKGVVSSQGRPIAGARVMASHNPEMGSSCDPPECTHDVTTTEGQFRLDLTRIRAQNGDDIRLSVSAQGFELFSNLVTLDVRAMAATATAHKVDLRPARPPIGPQP
jgi:hypothetical protein